ncbi:F-box/kelch-repeat protein [Trifolium repens]|nr:F-box/kelch-repeat protein [Trifolium repens]
MSKFESEKVRNHIPNDLAFSIMSKLPLKSLKRFGCVSKTWSLLFQNSHFLNMLHTNFISNPHIYFNDTSLVLHEIVYSDESTQLRFSLHSPSGERIKDIVKLDFPNQSQ